MNFVSAIKVNRCFKVAMSPTFYVGEPSYNRQKKKTDRYQFTSVAAAIFVLFVSLGTACESLFPSLLMAVYARRLKVIF